MAFMAIEYLFIDSLIAFKSAFLTCLGIYIVSIFNLFFKDGRPFWQVPQISSFADCVFAFASPDLSCFILTFYWGYVLIMHRLKFNKNPKSPLNLVILLFYILLTIAIYFTGVAMGVTYLY